MLAPPKIAAFNLHAVAGLLNSAAYARAAKAQIYQGSSRFSESSFANALLIAITGEPGFPEVMMDAKQIELAQRKHLEELIRSALHSIGFGPRAFACWLEQITNERAQNNAAVQAIFRGATATGNQISGNLNTVIKSCAAVQLASTVVVAATPVGLTFAGASVAASAGWIAFGYSVSKSLAKNLSEAKGARVIAFDVSKDVLKKAGDAGAEKVEKALEKKLEHHADLIEQAEQKIAQLSRMVQQKVSTSKIAKLNRQISRIESAAVASGSTVTRARIGRLACKSLTVVFAAHDVYEGWEDFEQVWNAREP